MKKVLSILLCGIVLLTCSFGLSGCILNRENPYPYRGDCKELYTAAIYSIPAAEGYMYHGEGAFDAEIYVWEQDDYGRTLFAYCEDVYLNIFALVIAQAYDEANVYVYPDVNYVLTFTDPVTVPEEERDNSLKIRTEAFYSEAKDALKEKNDWNQPLDKSKCVSYPITNHKALGDNVYSLHEDQCNEILNGYTETLNFVNPDDTPYRRSRVLQVDSEGRVLHEIEGRHTHYDRLEWNRWDPYAKDFTYYHMILWVITDQDGNYDAENGILVVYSKANELDKRYIYDAEDVLAFKKQNNWTNAYCGE